jgi:uncharacterized protein YjbI with pentapeptide repeats
MKISTISGEAIAESDTLSLIQLVEQNKANLAEAALWGVNLSGANLSRADLSRADLIKANLWGANLNKTIL